MAANGAEGKALWDTESSWSGFGNLSAPSSAQQVGFVAKDYLLHWSQGIARFVWYAYDGGPIWGGLWTPGIGESPAAASYMEIYHWLVGATLTASCSANHNGIWSTPWPVQTATRQRLSGSPTKALSSKFQLSISSIATLQVPSTQSRAELYGWRSTNPLRNRSSPLTTDNLLRSEGERSLVKLLSSDCSVDPTPLSASSILALYFSSV